MPIHCVALKHGIHFGIWNVWEMVLEYLEKKKKSIITTEGFCQLFHYFKNTENFERTFHLKLKSNLLCESSTIILKFKLNVSTSQSGAITSSPNQVSGLVWERNGWCIASL